ncbi:MAG: hypothetical protein Q7R48_01485 [bacterium]|nr:hypothetical protein [bacterium]
MDVRKRILLIVAIGVIGMASGFVFRNLLSKQPPGLQSSSVPNSQPANLDISFFSHPVLVGSLWSGSVQGIVEETGKEALTLRAVRAIREGDKMTGFEADPSGDTVRLEVESGRTSIFLAPKTSEPPTKERVSPVELSSENIRTGDHIIGMVEFRLGNDGTWKTIAKTLTVQRQ